MLQLAGLEVDAISLGGLRTCIQLPGLDLAFDMGCCPDSAVNRSQVLFTHTHIDHIGAVGMHCATRALYQRPPPHYTLPPGTEENFRALMDAWGRLDGTPLSYTAQTVLPDAPFSLKKNITARAFRTVHRVVSQGYILQRSRSKLRPSWLGRPGPEIAAARRAGEDIFEIQTEDIVAFTGDTRIDALDSNPAVYQARLLIMEVTFHDADVSVKRSRAMGHIHLDEVIERADRFENQAILFTHRSMRYGEQQVRSILQQRLPPTLLQRVTLLPDQ